MQELPIDGFSGPEMTPKIQITDDAVVISELRTMEDAGLATLSSSRPAMRWTFNTKRGTAVQLGYEIERSPSPSFESATVSTGRIESNACTGAPWPGIPLKSREVVWCRVRLWTGHGITNWSEPLKVVASLYESDCWRARPIFLKSCIDAEYQRAPVLLRKDFEAREQLISARLYVTAQGLHETYINGSRISEDLFEPGWTDYGHRLLYASHDVTNFIRRGANVIGATLGDGWWRGNLTWLPKRAVYGASTSYLAQLELTYADGTNEIVATDASWRGSTGSVIEADFYNGCVIDLSARREDWLASGFNSSLWEEASIGPLPTGLKQRSMPAVRVVDELDVRLTRHTDSVLVDCGQNLTGWLKLSVHSANGTTITVRHAEVLEPNGALHLSSLRTAKSIDKYLVPAGTHCLEPQFTYHGFRYATIELGSDGVLIDCVAQVVSTDLERIGHFSCSDERVNRLYENIIWSQRGNFISIPTDCPQRDERLGWTGDIQVFAPTACANFDCRSFLSSWLEDLANEQRADGNVPSTVPNVIWGHPFEYGGVGWGDAATLVPWAIFEAYGDPSVLNRQFTSMKSWVDYGLSRLDDEGIWRGDFHLGDWLDPAAPLGHPELATTDRDFIATSYLAHSARTLGMASAVLGNAVVSEDYQAIAERVAAAAWSKWQSQAPLTQTGCAMAIAYDIAPIEEHPGLGCALANLVSKAKGIGTGFLGTPLVLPALTRTGQLEAAATLLLDDEYPGWLYQVRKGATTLWERWDAIRQDGSIHKGDLIAEDSPGMMSFNHYAYGSVGAWLYRDLAGIAPARAGYEAIDFSPAPLPGIGWAKASIKTPRGMAAISWEVSGLIMRIECRIPCGASGRLQVPAGWESELAIAGQLETGIYHFELVRRCS